MVGDQDDNVSPSAGMLVVSTVGTGKIPIFDATRGMARLLRYSDKGSAYCGFNAGLSKRLPE